jgi:xanthine dehydrogenase large subunit
MLAISVHSAINQAISQASGAARPGRSIPALDAPATPERVLMCLQGRRAS